MKMLSQYQKSLSKEIVVNEIEISLKEGKLEKVVELIHDYHENEKEYEGKTFIIFNKYFLHSCADYQTIFIRDESNNKLDMIGEIDIDFVSDPFSRLLLKKQPDEHVNVIGSTNLRLPILIHAKRSSEKVYKDEFDYYYEIDYKFIKELEINAPIKDQVEGDFFIIYSIRGSKRSKKLQLPRWIYRKIQLTDLKDYQFGFNKLKGKDIRTSFDLWHLLVYADEYQYYKKRKYARKRLAELGKVFEYKEFMYSLDELEKRISIRKYLQTSSHYIGFKYL